VSSRHSRKCQLISFFFYLLFLQYFKKVTFSCHFVVSRSNFLFCIRGWTVPINLCAKTTTASGEEESTRFIIDLDFMCGIFIRVRLLLYAQSSKKCVWFDYLIFKSFSICFYFSKKLLFCTLCLYMYCTTQGKVPKLRTSFECENFRSPMPNLAVVLRLFFFPFLHTRHVSFFS
jgi:hypothetical protein